MLKKRQEPKGRGLCALPLGRVATLTGNDLALA